MSEIKKEADLSPLVMAYWKNKGYCVHGEVSVFKKRIFIDHIAHKGCCKSPTDVVGIEMKLNPTKDVIKQLNKIQRQHVVCEEWAIFAKEPTPYFMKLWESHKKRKACWAHYGLMYWNGEDFVIVEEPSKRDERGKKKVNHKRLVLEEENIDKVGGVLHGKRTTTRTIVKDKILAFVSEKGEVSFDDIYQEVLPYLSRYKKKKLSFRNIIKHMHSYHKKYPIETQTLTLEVFKKDGVDFYKPLKNEKEEPST